ncbi:MAG TPA: hypothetical protein PLJ19_07655 [Dysgonamonadaceae bacterium]|nr:hypothetical protein [Dysgonamonadaceae bacterium]
MKDYLERSILLASLAVFRELYDSEKDIYDIISEFLKEVIVSKAKYQFTVTEITQLLNDEFDFSIPEAVIKTSLKRLPFLSKSYGEYTIKGELKNLNTNNISNKLSEIQQNNNLILQDLFTYIEDETHTQLTEQEKGKIIGSFCSFILDEAINHEYSEYVSAFIIKNRSNSDFTKILTIIKEGVVLYSGLKYNPNPSELGSWKTYLTIFLDTEILFHLAGYNGLLFKELFNDFYSLVNEINQNSQKKDGKKLIQLKYFTDVKNEIELFFKKAEDIINGKDKPDPSVTAMTTILNGCKTASDIIAKKIEFYSLLKTYGIEIDDSDSYYTSNKHKHNPEDLSTIENLESSTNTENIGDNLKFLNYINIRRKGKFSRNFEDISYILLTGNSKTLRIAANEEMCPKGNIPLATTLDFLTNNFWFKLGKGFGKNHYPKNFDIITKAQILISSQLNDSVGKQYDELKVKYNKGEINEEQATLVIVELRNKAKKPEEIGEAVISDALVSISENSIESIIQEQQLFKSKAFEQEEENKRLKQNLSDKNAEIEKMEKESREEKEELEKYREIEKRKLEQKQKRIKISLTIFLALIFLSVCILIFLYLNKTIGIIIGIISSIFTILNFFGFNYKTIKRKNKY